MSEPRQLRVIASAPRRLQDGQRLDANLAEEVRSNSLQLVITEVGRLPACTSESKHCTASTCKCMWLTADSADRVDDAARPTAAC